MMQSLWNRQVVAVRDGCAMLDISCAMVPIQKLLSRIRWDANFSSGQFELGYFDRVEDRVILVPFQAVEFPSKDPRAFRLVDAEGRFHRVPFHRVREVHKDGQRIWHRRK